MKEKKIKSFNWLALMIGNSRLHWAWFQGDNLKETWESEHVNTVVKELTQEILPPHFTLQFPNLLPLYIASVVPGQTTFWQTYPNSKLITLEHIPLKRIYSTMGIDRALAVWGTGITYGFPCLVIDAGTALTFTGVNRDRVLGGGAILPGLKLQLQSLSNKTAVLPEVSLPQNLPQRWALATQEAIVSGVIYTVLAAINDFIQDWCRQFPESLIALTGGDSTLLLRYLKIQHPEIAQRLIVDSNLIFWGMRDCCR